MANDTQKRTDQILNKDGSMDRRREDGDEPTRLGLLPKIPRESQQDYEKRLAGQKKNSKYSY